VQAFFDARVAELAVLWADPMQRVAMAAGLAGAVLVIWSGFAKTIVPLRWLAVGSNLGFIVYGWVHPAPLVLLLHLTLLPINLWRVLEMRRLVTHVRRARAGEGLPQVWLQPYMKRKRLRPGRVLFSKGDPAERLYVLAEGALHVVESHRVVQPGELIGEISFFSRDGKRTATVVSPVGGPGATLLSMDEPTFRQLFHQNPAFGYEVVRLVTERLTADVAQLRAELTQARAAKPPTTKAPRRLPASPEASP
jgi:CRP/FNR family transcriptional regulator, cyclic AMP receptor protein